jgi:hypothetical protein
MLKSKKASRMCNDGSPFVVIYCLERSEPSPGGSRGELARSTAVADVRLTIFCLTRASIVRQIERLECTKNIRQPMTFDACARVAKGPPSGTSENQGWRPGARRQSALADWPGMSVTH